MRTLRTRLAVLTLMLLAQQALALAVVGVLACCETDPPQAAQMECCKAAGEGHMCPLTNRRPPDNGSRMKGGCSTDGPGMLADAGFLFAAPLAGRVRMMPAAVIPNVWPVVVSEEVCASVPPPTPPPKG